MAEIRFSYNPFTKDFIDCPTSHATALYNKGKQKLFDEYIRGIILGNTLYLRTFYPFDDLNTLSLVELNQKSRTLSEQYIEKILSIVEREYNLKGLDIVYNADNDLLTGKGLANI